MGPAAGDDLQVDDGRPPQDRQQAGRVLLAAVQGQQEALLQVKKGEAAHLGFRIGYGDMLLILRYLGDKGHK